MALRLRRGTNAERLTIIPQEGELIYTTDTKELYAGDGSTIGGLRVTGSTEGSPAALTQDLDLASNNITGIGSIDITGTVTANFDGDVIGNVLGDLTGNVTGDVRGSVFGDNNTLLVDAFNSILSGDVIGNVTGDVRGSVFGDDSTLIVDAVNNKLNGDLTGNVFGNDGTLLVDAFNRILSGDLTGNVFGFDDSVLVDAVNRILIGDLNGNVTGDVRGSVFGDDSTLLVDAFNRILIGDVIGHVQGSVFGDDSTVIVDGVNNTLSALALTTSSINPSNNILEVAGIVDTASTQLRINSGPTRASEIHFGRGNSLASDLSGDTIPHGRITFSRTDSINAAVTTAFIVARNDILTLFHNPTGNTSDEPSYVTMKDANFGIGTLSPTEKLDVRGNAVVTGFVQFGSLSTTDRNALTAVNGMVIYNTTDNKFQGYENGAWVNLV
jgi:hypothetical protein